MAARFEWKDDDGGPVLAAGGTVLSCFPSAGLAPTVAAHYMIQSLGLPRIGVFDSEDALPLAIVQGGRVQPPIRVYGRPDLAILVSEFPPSPGSVVPLARAILDGAKRLRSGLVLAVEGVVPHPASEPIPAGGTPLAEEQVWTIAAQPDDALRARFDRAGTRTLQDGVIGGISGALLVQGQARRQSVAALLVSARNTEGYPDHRAGAALIETIDRLLPAVQIDTGPLRTQAEVIERALRSAMKNSRLEGRSGPSAPPGPAVEPTMYQ